MIDFVKFFPVLDHAPCETPKIYPEPDVAFSGVLPKSGNIFMEVHTRFIETQ
jgi:hypothetical protein